jgi:flagellar biosynthesis/type III secretory pathway chaperone
MTKVDGISALLAELRQVLEEERAALLCGDLGRLTGAVDRKLALAETIENEYPANAAVQPSSATLHWLYRFNQGNSIICSAMLRHLTRTIDKLRHQQPHRSYGPDGAESSPSVQKPLGAA